jgi:acyl-CoA thioesterase I
MSPPSNKIIARAARAIAATAIFSALAAAHAEFVDPALTEPALIAAPASTSVATPAMIYAASPATTPAAPITRPTPAGALKPATLPPLAAAAPVACTAPGELARLDHPLGRTARRLASGLPLTIVAIGSSSTAGAGASSPAATYPSRLAVELQQRFPGHAITVLNRGVNGDETDQMMARFETGVFAEHPQLILWQVGTNSVLRDRPLEAHSLQLHEGVDELKATGADVIMIDPQYTPRVVEKPETLGMVDQIAVVAKEKNVGLFRRFAIMRDWHDVQHQSFDAFTSPDGLHMNDWSYACVAKLLAAAIADAASRPIASAAVHETR